MSNMMAEQLVRATLARFEADRQEAIAGCILKSAS